MIPSRVNSSSEGLWLVSLQYLHMNLGFVYLFSYFCEESHWNFGDNCMDWHISHFYYVNFGNRQAREMFLTFSVFFNFFLQCLTMS